MLKRDSIEPTGAAMIDGRAPDANGKSQDDDSIVGVLAAGDEVALLDSRSQASSSL